MASKNDYVYVEMIRDQGGEKYEVIAGLFKGLLEDDGNNYILLNGLKGSTECILIDSKDGFDFLSIEVLEQDFRNMTYLTNETSDQEAALNIINAVFKELKEDGLEEKAGCGIIDIDKYQYVPKEYLEGKPIDAAGTNKGTGVGTFSNRTNHYGTTTGHSYTTHTPKPTPVPSVFKRTKSPKPTAAALDGLSALITDIKDGVQILPLPETPGDDPADVATTCATDDDADIYAAGGWP